MNYFNEFQWQQLFRRYRETGSVEMLHELVESLELVCKGVVRHFGQTCAVVDFDDLVQTAVTTVMESVDQFDPIKGTAFNFFTTIALRATRKAAQKDDFELSNDVGVKTESREIVSTDIKDGTRFGELLSLFVSTGEIVTRRRFVDWLHRQGENTKGVYLYLQGLKP